MVKNSKEMAGNIQEIVQNGMSSYVLSYVKLRDAGNCLK